MHIGRAGQAAGRPAAARSGDRSSAAYGTELSACSTTRARTISGPLKHDPFKAIVAPRPIGWITSISAKGEINLAPYSYFNGVTEPAPIW